MTTQNGNMAQCLVTVKRSITSLAVSPTSKKLIVGQTLQLSKTVTPSNTTEGTVWTSSNNSVATVSSSGLVTAKGVGTATITLKASESNVSATCIVKVETSDFVVATGSVNVYDDTSTYSETGGRIAKYNGSGNMIWEVSLGRETAYSIKKDFLGNYVVGAGYYGSEEEVIDEYGHIYKFNSNGKKLWEYKTDRRIAYVEVSYDGGYYAIDNNKSFLKLDTNGKLVWKKNPTHTDGRFGAIAITSDGGFIIVESNVLVKFDKNGNELWYKKCYSSRENHYSWDGNAYSIIQTSDGGYLVGNGFGGGSVGGNLFKCDSSGNYQWHNGMIESTTNTPYCLVETLDGYYAVVAPYCYLAKIDKSGKKIWSKTKTSKYLSSIASMYSLVQFADESYVVGGDGALIKYDKNGNEIWIKGLNEIIRSVAK